MSEFNPEEFDEILTSVLRADQIVPFDCYILLHTNQRIIHFLEKDKIPSGDQLDKLKNAKVRHLYIRLEDKENYENYLNEFLDSEQGKEFLENLNENKLIPKAIRKKVLESKGMTFTDDDGDSATRLKNKKEMDKALDKINGVLNDTIETHLKGNSNYQENLDEDINKVRGHFAEDEGKQSIKRINQAGVNKAKNQFIKDFGESLSSVNGLDPSMMEDLLSDVSNILDKDLSAGLDGEDLSFSQEEFNTIAEKIKGDIFHRLEAHKQDEGFGEIDLSSLKEKVSDITENMSSESFATIDHIKEKEVFKLPTKIKKELDEQVNIIKNIGEKSSEEENIKIQDQAEKIEEEIQNVESSIQEKQEKQQSIERVKGGKEESELDENEIQEIKRLKQEIEENQNQVVKSREENHQQSKQVISETTSEKEIEGQQSVENQEKIQETNQETKHEGGKEAEIKENKENNGQSGDDEKTIFSSQGSNENNEKQIIGSSEKQDADESDRMTTKSSSTKEEDDIQKVNSLGEDENSKDQNSNKKDIKESEKDRPDDPNDSQKVKSSQSPQQTGDQSELGKFKVLVMRQRDLILKLKDENEKQKETISKLNSDRFKNNSNDDENDDLTIVKGNRDEGNSDNDKTIIESSGSDQNEPEQEVVEEKKLMIEGLTGIANNPEDEIEEWQAKYEELEEGKEEREKELNEVIEALRAENDELSEKFLAGQIENGGLVDKLAGSEEAERLAKEAKISLAEAQEFIAKNENYISSLEGESTEKDKQLSELRAKNEENLIKIENLSQAADQTELLLERREKEMDDLKNLINDQSSILSAKEGMLKKLGDKIKQWEMNKGALGDDGQVLGEVIKDQENLLVKANANRDAEREKVKQLNKEHEKLKNHIEKANALKKRLAEKMEVVEGKRILFLKKEETLNKKVMQLTNLNEKSRQTIAKLTSVSEQLKTEKSVLIDESRAEGRKDKDLKGKVDLLNRGVAVEKQRREALEKQMERLQANEKDNKVEIGEKNKKIKELEDELRALKHQLKLSETA